MQDQPTGRLLGGLIHLGRSMSYQLDLFEPAPRLAGIHPSNQNAYAMADCLCEEIEAMPGYRFEILYAQAADGWRFSAGYMFPTQGSCGPVFIRTNAYPTQEQARVATFCAGKLLIERGTPATKELGVTFRMTGMVASDELQAIGKRYRTTGRLIGTGEQYRNIKDALDAMRNIIPVLSRGELLTVLHEAAQIVEEGIETAKRIKRAERKAA